MPNFTEKDLMVCDECLQAIAYDEYSGLDYYGAEYSERRYKEITEGIERVCKAHGWISMGDDDHVYEALPCVCDVCGDKTKGKRHHMVAMREIT